MHRTGTSDKTTCNTNKTTLAESLPVFVAHLFAVTYTEAPRKNCSDFCFSAEDKAQPGSKEAALCAKNMQITFMNTEPNRCKLCWKN